MVNVTNLLDEVPQTLPEELIQTLAASKHVRIERIISDQHSSPLGFWYDQEWSEWVCVIQGCAILEFQSPKDEIILEAGDCLLIEAHRKHRVLETSSQEKTIWLAVHYQ
jgi:cupin 2 domain-containing protein